MKSSLVLCAVLMASPSAPASCQTLVSTQEAASIANEIRMQVLKSDQFPTERPPTIRWLVKPKTAAQKDSSPRVGVVQIRFDGLTNSYCRLVVSARSPNPTFVLVPVPEPANHDTCKGIRSFHAGDLNGDSLTDYWYVEKVQSNRYTTDVGEAIVFLGQPEKAEALCYSSTASRAIDPANTSDTAVASAVTSMLKRLGQEKLGCD